MSEDRIVLTEILGVIDGEKPDSVMIMTDSNVAEIESRLIASLQRELEERGVWRGPMIITPAGEENKNLVCLEQILSHMTTAGLTRRSMLICIGGGMATDMGGFAAAIFKRGIRHLNVATTLLGAVDAAVGGKTAIDFRGLKNEIGAFHMPVSTLADAESFATLPDMEILSGFGEVIKTAYISDADMTHRILRLDPLEADARELAEICSFCRREKMRVVDADPTEKGLRKILNFGHTAGHAIESLLLEKGKPLPHGVAVAHGILIALILSMMIEGLEKREITDYAQWLRRYYPAAEFTCADYDSILTLATHDKKNSHAGSFSFSLLRSIGDPTYDRSVSADQLKEALDIYQELMGR